jgi:hypothetical protein
MNRKTRADWLLELKFKLAQYGKQGLADFINNVHAYHHSPVQVLPGGLDSLDDNHAVGAAIHALEHFGLVSTQ